ncbi:MAG: acyltransferase [Microgenomates group bacterium]|nr:acyltransferase [Microgenomates group bacterium]
MKEINQRLFFLDWLKSISIAALILIHSLSYFTDQKLIFEIWNYLHFVVVAFVFASAYILYLKYQTGFKDLQKAGYWIGKRLKRLLVPYYIYLFSHYFLWWFFPNFFKGLGLQNNRPFFIKSLFLIGGVNHNWFVLLFIQLTLFFPILIYLKNHKKFLYYLLFLNSCFFSIYFINFRPTGENYRFLMFFPWLLVYFIAFFFAFFDQRKKDYQKYLVFFTLLAFSLFIFQKNLFFDSNYVLIQKKYPPDIYFLIYGLMTCFLLIFLSQLKFLKLNFSKKIINFLAGNSYSLYFIHYLVLDPLINFKKSFSPLEIFVLVFLISVFIVYFINKSKNFILLSLKQG